VSKNEIEEANERTRACVRKVVEMTGASVSFCGVEDGADVEVLNAVSTIEDCLTLALRNETKCSSCGPTLRETIEGICIQCLLRKYLDARGEYERACANLESMGHTLLATELRSRK